MQTFAEPYNAAFAGEIAVPMTPCRRWRMDERKIIARRAALELKAEHRRQPRHRHAGRRRRVAAEEQVIDLITLTAEPGVIGGMPAGGLNFGAATNTAGDHRPAVPVRLLRRRRPRRRLPRPGPGRPRRATSTSASSARARRRRRLHQHQPERQEGGVRRHLHRRRARSGMSRTARCASLREGDCAQVRATRSSTAPSAAPMPPQRGQPVLYITERCVFALTAEGLELIEIAPGIDLERDILAQMDFAPAISGTAAPDGRAHLPPEPMGLREQLLRMPLERRFTYDAAEQLFFINFERLRSVRWKMSSGSVGWLRNGSRRSDGGSMRS